MGGASVFAHWMTIISVWLSILLISCGPLKPIRIGFVGGISGRVADLGIAGRNGAQLAVEWRNEAGGVAGRPVELLIRDDQQNPDLAEQVTRDLIKQDVAAIIGPMTSAMAMRMTPIANQAQVILMSPTVVTNHLSGQDDYFFRVVSGTRQFASKSALYQRNTQQLKRVAAVYDLGNQAYAKSWLDDFSDVFTGNGGEIVKTLGFESSSTTRLLQIARDLLAEPVDGVVIIANSVDTALLCQQIRKLDQHLPIAVAEWGATEGLIELGGNTVEGVVTAQFFDRNSKASGYQKFYRAYRQRFGQDPGFAGVAGFDAANVLLDALAQRPAGQSLKQTLLAMRHFAGVQNPVIFDDFGDARRDTFIAVVRGGQFVIAQ